MLLSSKPDALNTVKTPELTSKRGFGGFGRLIGRGDGQETGSGGGISAEKGGSGGDGGGQKPSKKTFLMCFEGFGMKS